MATTSNVGSTNPTAANQIDYSTKSGYQSLTTDDFVQLLVTQLQNQNPLDPMKDSDLTQQVSAIQSLNSTSQLVSTLDSFGQNQSLGAASGLIGREISGKVDNKEVTGVADKAIVQDGKVYVTIGDTKVPFDSITSVGSASSSSGDSTLSKLLSSLTNKTDTSSDSTSNATADQMASLLSAMQAQSQSDAASSDSSTGSDTASQQDMIDALQSMASSGGSA